MSDEPQHVTHTQFTEAPYSGNVRARIRGYDWQLTIRAGDSTTFTQKVDALMNWLDQKADKAINVDLLTVTATKPPAPTSAPQTTQAIGGTFHIVKMAVKPRTDGKVDLEFFEAGHKWADVKAAKTPADAAMLMQPIGAWTPEHFVSAAEYEINCLIDWKPSTNLNKNGQPYKNIAAVKPANV